MGTRLAEPIDVWSDGHVRHPIFSLGRRRRRRSVWESFVMLSDDPPSLCCSGDDLCEACRL